MGQWLKSLRFSLRLKLLVTHWKNIFFSLCLIFCMFLYPERTHAGCGVSDPFTSCPVHYVCDTQAQAIDYIYSMWSTDLAGINIIYMDPGYGGYVQACFKEYPSCGGGGVCFGSGSCTGSNTQSCTITIGNTNCPGTQTCSSGQWGACQSIDACCGSKDRCCGVADRCCTSGNGSGGT